MSEFSADIASKAELFKKALAVDPEAGVLLLHHNDTDGLTSGVILTSAFEREGYTVRRYCLEKPYPEVLERIFALEADHKSVVVFADFGSGMLPDIARINADAHEVFVVDHHGIHATDNSHIHPVNCILHDIPGNRDCSASAVCYLFAKALNAKNSDQAGLAVLGAVGDRHFDLNGKLTGVNKENFLSAQKSNLAVFNKEYSISCRDTHSALELRSCLDALGSFGYFSGGPEQGFHALLHGISSKDLSDGKQLRSEFINATDAFLNRLTLKKNGRVEWFILDDSFSHMGVKTVGLVCEEIVTRKQHDPDCYLAGFQQVPDTIPGLGDIDLNMSKISMRVSPALKSKMEAGEQPALTDLLPDAARSIGGFVDACHLHAAAATVQIGDEERLIDALSSRL